jgi:hypothetical protein
MKAVVTIIAVMLAVDGLLAGIAQLQLAAWAVVAEAAGAVLVRPGSAHAVQILVLAMTSRAGLAGSGDTSTPRRSRLRQAMCGTTARDLTTLPTRRPI